MLPINFPKIGETLQRAFGLKGKIPMMLGQEVIPTSIVGDQSVAQEPPILRSCVAHFDFGAVVGERFVMTLTLPANVIGIIREIDIEPAGANSLFRVFFGASITPPATAQVTSFTDGRLLATAGQEPAGVLLANTQVAVLGTTQYLAKLTADIRNLIHPNNWVAGVGDPSGTGTIEMQGDVANLRFRGSIQWDEFLIV